ncbi:MAG: hypothetical protein QOK44_4168 [Betaproteobacteria bacterium]|nr:hypothetical protein [Betaproteobacteria bacterium]
MMSAGLNPGPEVRPALYCARDVTSSQAHVIALQTTANGRLSTFATAASAVDVERTGGPYVPTPQAVVDAMLELAKVGPRDFVIDLGSGDGRIVLTAAQRTARGAWASTSTRSSFSKTTRRRSGAVWHSG